MLVCVYVRMSNIYMCVFLFVCLFVCLFVHKVFCDDD
jgi:hypothetical protein